MTDFQNSFTVTLSRKFAIKTSLQIPPHLNGYGQEFGVLFFMDHGVETTICELPITPLDSASTSLTFSNNNQARTKHKLSF